MDIRVTDTNIKKVTVKNQRWPSGLCNDQIFELILSIRGTDYETLVVDNKMEERFLLFKDTNRPSLSNESESASTVT